MSSRGSRPSGASQRAKFCACCSASSSVGAISAAWKPASTTSAAASAATIVLPEPTSPCTRRIIGCGTARSRAHFAEDAPLRAGQREAGAGEQRPGELAVARERQGGIAADRRAQLPERELLREQLLEGEAPLRGMAAGREHVELRVRRRAMHVRQRLVQARKPELAHDLPRQEVRQFAVAHGGERLRREVPQAALLDALGHGIDRRQHVRDRLRVRRGRVPVFGMHDLGPVLAAAHLAEALAGARRAPVAAAARR